MRSPLVRDSGDQSDPILVCLLPTEQQLRRILHASFIGIDEIVAPPTNQHQILHRIQVFGIPKKTFPTTGTIVRERVDMCHFSGVDSLLGDRRFVDKLRAPLKLTPSCGSAPQLTLDLTIDRPGDVLDLLSAHNFRRLLGLCR